MLGLMMLLMGGVAGSALLTSDEDDRVEGDVIPEPELGEGVIVPSEDGADPTPIPEELSTALQGTDEDDVLELQEGGDFVNARGGDDLVTGSDGDDTLQGGGDNDTVSGGLGDDVLLGGNNHDDTLDGGMGDDTLSGGTGNDVLRGGLGDDLFIVGGPDGDSDTVIAGEGADTIEVSGDYQLFVDLNDVDGAVDAIVPLSGSGVIEVSGFQLADENGENGDVFDTSALVNANGDPIGNGDFSIEQRDIIDGIASQIVLEITNGDEDDTLRIVFDAPDFVVPDNPVEFLMRAGIIA